MNSKKQGQIMPQIYFLFAARIIDTIPITEEEVAIAEKEMEGNPVQLPEELTDIERIWKRLRAQMV